MRCITVWQPYASLIVHGIKTIETRPTEPNGPMRIPGRRGYPGLPIQRGERIAIHAAARKPTTGVDVGDWYWEDTYADPECIVYAPLDRWEQHPAPTGAVVGSVEVVDALPIVAESGTYDDELYVTVDGKALYRQTVIGDPSVASNVVSTDHTDDLPLGDYTPGRSGWLLANPEPASAPIPAKGRQGVWEWSP